MQISFMKEYFETVIKQHDAGRTRLVPILQRMSTVSGRRKIIQGNSIIP